VSRRRVFRGTPSLDADFNLSLTAIHVGLRGDSALGAGPGTLVALGDGVADPLIFSNDR
jgi:hypothetical protein